MTMMIDPPSGWKYGFPKPIPQEAFTDENGCPKDTRLWLVENGYPQELIDELGEHFYCRYYEQPTAILKFNSGMLAILCSECSKILKTGKDFNQEELDFAKGEAIIPPQYCENCKDKN